MGDVPGHLMILVGLFFRILKENCCCCDFAKNGDMRPEEIEDQTKQGEKDDAF
jgi:hypothetical protein